MRLRQAAYVVAVAEEGSFTRAAARLHVSQPTLSQQVRALERRLGGPLLERAGTGVSPTPAGRAFVAEARIAIGALERAEAAARAVSEGRAGDLTVATVRSVAAGILPDAVRRLRARHPDVVVRLVEIEHRDRLEAEMRSGLGDVAVGPPPLRWDGALEPVGEQRFCVVLPEAEAARSAAPVRIGDLAGRPWVLYPPDYGLADVVATACAAHGFTPRAGAVTGHAETAARLAAAGLGPAIVPVAAVPVGLAHAVRPLDPPLTRPLVAYARGTWTALAAEFVRAVKGIA